jgi:hypothetical protein
MDISEKTLARKLAYVLVIKLAVLLVLWCLFVRDQGIEVTQDRLTEQFFTPIASTEQGSMK